MKNYFYIVMIFVIGLIFSCEEEKDMTRLKIVNRLDDSVRIFIDKTGLYVRGDTVIAKNDISLGIHSALFIFPPTDTLGTIESFSVAEDNTAWLFVEKNSTGDTVVYHRWEDNVN